ncbi:MAG: hypothetical protein ACXWQE_13130 [Bdellovibrionales bacterium]
MRNAILALTLLLLPGVAFARGRGAGSGAQSLKSPDSLYGLCSQDLSNVDSDWTKGQPNTSYCQDIDSTLDEQKGCDIGGGKPPPKKSLKSDMTISQQLSQDKDFLDSLKKEDAFKKDSACLDKIEQIKGDPTKWNLFLKQIFASLFIQENEWKSGPTSSMGAQGLGQLDPASVKAYGKCNKACAEIGKTRVVKGGKDHIGDHNNVKCAVAIGLYWMGRDGKLGEGSGNSGSYGMARYFQPFRNIDKKKWRDKYMIPKVAKYCKEAMDNEAGSAPKPSNWNTNSGK